MADLGWKVLAVGAGLAGSKLAKAATDGTWKAATGKQTPSNPADPDVEWKEALAFAIVSGAIMGLARMLTQRQAAQAYVKTTGKVPSAIQADGKNDSDE